LYYFLIFCECNNRATNSPKFDTNFLTNLFFCPNFGPNRFLDTKKIFQHLFLFFILIKLYIILLFNSVLFLFPFIPKASTQTGEDSVTMGCQTEDWWSSAAGGKSEDRWTQAPPRHQSSPWTATNFPQQQGQPASEESSEKTILRPLLERFVARTGQVFFWNFGDLV
jgi:hypothetical protein